MIQKIGKAFVLTALSATSPAFALQSDSRQPIQIEADRGSLDQTKQSTTFSGNVVIRQGTLNISASRVNVTRGGKGGESVRAEGSPVRFSQTLDGGKGTVRGQANNIAYSSAGSTVVLTGNAKVQRGGDVVEGAVITYNTQTEVYTVSGGAKSAAKSGRVSVVIQPAGAQSE